MKRSQINRTIEEMKALCQKHQFLLPPWAFWAPLDWKGRAEQCREIIENALGWDVTDFGSGRFEERGLALFTLRNGNAKTGHSKTYAEKIMMVGEDQETPLHFHWQKTEDIIARGGGNLVFELRNSVSDDTFNNHPVTVYVDGVRRAVGSGAKLILRPGESIYMEQRLFHCFYAEAGSGTALVGEVSRVNDDETDNNFCGGAPRYPEIIEDKLPVHLLCNEYTAYV